MATDSESEMVERSASAVCEVDGEAAGLRQYLNWQSGSEAFGHSPTLPRNSVRSQIVTVESIDKIETETAVSL